MSRRSKQNTTYWRQQREKLYQAHPESKLVKNRYRSLKALLAKRYPDIQHEDLYDYIKDAIYLDRQIRLETEESEKELKIILSQEKQLELDK
jgi:hypothetical protein